MKKLILIMLISVVSISGCSSNKNALETETELIRDLRNEIAILQAKQDDFTSEIIILKEEVKELKDDLILKEQEIEFLNMDLESLFRLNNIQDTYFSSSLNESIRLFGFGEVQELMCLVESFDYNTNHITVKNKNDEINEYTVSDECKVLVAGQDYIIFQTIIEGKDFIDSVTKDEVHKVILVLKNGIVEQIKMYCAGDWLQ